MTIGIMILDFRALNQDPGWTPRWVRCGDRSFELKTNRKHDSEGKRPTRSVYTSDNGQWSIVEQHLFTR